LKDKSPENLKIIISWDSSAQGSDCIPVTIGSLFRRIVKALQAQDNNPDSYLNNPKSDLNNPNYDINNPSSYINNPNSEINNSSNNQYNKEQRRNALRELIQMYLSEYISAEQAEQFVTEYIP
jgi:hypothetical protein